MSNVRAWLSGGHVHFLQLATRLTGVTRRDAPSRYKSRQCISCWCAARCSWSRSRYPSVRAVVGRYYAVFTRSQVGRSMQSGLGTRLDAVFPILQRLVHADFAAVDIGFYAQCWSCFSELDVGWSEPFLFIFNRKTNYGNHTLELTSHCLTSDWQLKDCDTFCSMAYIFKGHLNNIRKWLFVFENIID